MINFDLHSSYYLALYQYLPAGQHFSFHFSGISLPRKPLCILFASPGVQDKWLTNCHVMIIYVIDAINRCKVSNQYESVAIPQR